MTRRRGRDGFEPVKHIATVRRKTRYLRVRCSGIWVVLSYSRNSRDVSQTYQRLGGAILIGSCSKMIAPGLLVKLLTPSISRDSPPCNTSSVTSRQTGYITAAIAHAGEVGGLLLLLNAEVRKKDEATRAIAAGADVIMLDNIEGNKLASVVRCLSGRWIGEGKVFPARNESKYNLSERAPSHRR
ncbi:hypothetical protein BJV74DRAFT_978747 [Russula compacta]|nr:hypothetical protein BJV74DRAFT_978747 [Russula compacta]